QKEDTDAPKKFSDNNVPAVHDNESNNVQSSEPDISKDNSGSSTENAAIEKAGIENAAIEKAGIENAAIEKAGTENSATESASASNTDEGTPSRPSRKRTRSSLNVSDGIKSPNLMEKSEFDNDPSLQGYRPIQLVSRPWIKPEGTLNKPTFKIMIEAVLLFIMTSPGCTSDAINARFNPSLQPIAITELTEILEEIGCIKRIPISKPLKPSLFSKPGAGPVNRWQKTILHMASIDCIGRLGQFDRHIDTLAWNQSKFLDQL
ncbi:unnamed protein product, partial [Owenia fusiformis]